MCIMVSIQFKVENSCIRCISMIVLINGDLYNGDLYKYSAIVLSLQTFHRFAPTWS